MKLSFSLSTKPSSKQQQQQQTNLKPSQNFNSEDHQDSTSSLIINREYVTEFDPSKTLADSQSKKKLVIPPKPNEWRPHKKMKNLDLPVASDCPNLRFETESPTFVAEALDSNMSYGLNLRESTKSDDANNNVESIDRPRPPATIESVMLKKLKDDLERLPDDRGFEEFTDVPVEGFGAALLAGYGWVEGRGIGKNAKEDVKVVQYERRTAKEGLGFVSDMSTNSNVTSNGITKKENEKEQHGRREEGRWYYVGKDVRIVGGRDLGLKGRIVKILGDGDPVVLKISKTGEEVTVRVRHIADLGSVEEERCLKKLKELKIRRSNDEVGVSDGGRVKDSYSSRSHKESREDKKKDSKRSREEGRRSDRREEKTSRISWLTSHIRVRVISKELKGGRLYLKKGEILDVVGPTTCDISIDESRELIQGVDQGLLETALPRRGGPVLVLYGKNKGVYGNLVERDMENETGVVRDADTHALLNVRLEQIAEYIGDPSYIGY